MCSILIKYTCQTMRKECKMIKYIHFFLILRKDYAGEMKYTELYKGFYLSSNKDTFLAILNHSRYSSWFFSTKTVTNLLKDIGKVQNLSNLDIRSFISIKRKYYIKKRK